MIAADGTIYVATNGGVLHALDPSTGTDQWTFAGQGASTGSTDLSTSPLVLPTGEVLWPGPVGTLYLLTNTGRLVWQHAFGAALTSPVLSGSNVFVGTTDGALVALDVSGALPRERWQLAIGRSSYGSPVVAPDGEILTTADDRLVAVRDEGTTATVVWHRSFEGAVEVSAAVGGTAPWSSGPTTPTSTHSLLPDVSNGESLATCSRTPHLRSAPTGTPTSAGTLGTSKWSGPRRDAPCTPTAG